MRKWKRWLGCLMIMVIVLLSGCNHQAGPKETVATTEGIFESVSESETANQLTQNDDKGIDTDLVYHMTVIEDAEGLNPQMMASDGEKLAMLGLVIESEETQDGWVTRREYQIVCGETDGSDQKVFFRYEQIINAKDQSTYSTGYAMSVQQMAFAPDGNLIVIYRGTENDPGEYWMVKYDPSGNELWRTVIGESGSLRMNLLCADERIYLECGTYILVYDQNGAMLRQVVPGEFPEGIKANKMAAEMTSLQITDSGDAYVVYSYADNPSRTFVIKFDPETGELGEWKETPEQERIIPSVLDGRGSGYDMLLKTEEGLYGWNFDEDGVALVDLQSSGLKGGWIEELCPLGDGRMLCYCKNTDEGNLVCELKKMDPENADRKTIVIAVSSSWDLLDEVLQFNRSNDEWCIVLKEYNFAYEESLTQFGLDIANGDFPDILWLGQYDFDFIPYDSYVEQGIFEDLKGWFAQDPELNTEDYMTNVFDALAEDGKWYRVPTAFSFTTYVGKKSVLGDVDSLSLEELQALSEQYSTTVSVSGRRELLLRRGMITRWDQFVDEENATCNFESEEFIQWLEWLKDYPGPDDPMRYYPRDTRTDNLLVFGMEIDTFRKLIEYPAEWFGEETVTVGYPEASGNGGTVTPKGSIISIFAQSNCKEAAWEFVRTYFMDEHQDGINGNFPVKRSSIEKRLEEALDPMPPYGYDLDGGTYWVDTPSREELEQWIDYMSCITCAELVDTEVYNIIVEEADAFFYDLKSAEEVAKIIQNRVWIYLAEQQ